MAKYYYPVIFYPASGGKIIGVVPDMQGCLTQGDDLMQAMFWIVDAIGTWLDDPKVTEMPTPSKPDDIDTSEYPNAIVNIIEFDFDKWKASHNPVNRAREIAGLSIKDLSELLNAPYRTVQDWCNGNRHPPIWLQTLVIEKINHKLGNANGTFWRGKFITADTVTRGGGKSALELGRITIEACGRNIGRACSFDGK